jgi:GT2 family glycosyltransferase/glycosyltransferase involved in cell wall biosynthesis
MTSLRTRGWQSTLDRVRRQFQRVPQAAPADLYLPDDAPFAPFALPASHAPVASIVIPVFNQASHTLACLRALAAHPPRCAYEAIIVDDGSSDSTQAWMQQIDGLRYHRRSRNGGFIAACNDGAALARGRFIVFLNNDTVPQPGWLDALLRTFNDRPDAGLVGAQLLYPDGRLQEAGGVVFSDGSAWNYGRFEAPQDPRFASLREADYCSGAALAVPRDLFASVGGFDTRFSPAYYEDTDLAFAVRARGRGVLYQPLARVVHLEGATAGTDTSSGIKSYQVTNRAKFEDKWRAALAARLPPSCTPTPASLHAPQRQVLIVDSHTPEPDRDSASLRLFNLMRLLREEGAHVVFVEYELHHRGRYTDALRALGVEVWCRPYVASLPKWLAQQGARFATVMLCRYHLALQLMPVVRRHAPQARVLFDTVDLHYVREARRAELDADPQLARAAARTRVSELEAVAASDVTLVVSEAERERLASDAPGRRVEVLSNLHESGGEGAPFAGRKDLVFVGGFRHPPNVDAVRWFASEIMPLVRQALPGVVFHCIGGDPPSEILTLGRQPDIVVHGHVPDLQPAMGAMRVAVAPLRFGAGVKGKVNLSMAHGQPVVATSCAVEGMHLADGDDVLVADDAGAFADAIVRLYRDQALWQRLSEGGRRNVARHFSMDAARPSVRNLFLAPPR